MKEEDILAWKEHNGLRFLQCACRFTEQIAREQIAREQAAGEQAAGELETGDKAAGEPDVRAEAKGFGADIVHTSKRQEMKELIRQPSEEQPLH